MGVPWMDDAVEVLCRRIQSSTFVFVSISKPRTALFPLLTPVQKFFFSKNAQQKMATLRTTSPFKFYITHTRTVCGCTTVALAFQRGLSCCQAGDWNTVWRTADVVETRADTELDTVGLAAVLATDAALQFRTSRSTFLNGHLDQLADTRFVDLLERVSFKDLLFQVVRQE